MARLGTSGGKLGDLTVEAPTLGGFGVTPTSQTWDASLRKRQF